MYTIYIMIYLDRYMYIHVMHHKSAKNHVKSTSLVYSAEEALAETRVKIQKMLF